MCFKRTISEVDLSNFLIFTVDSIILRCLCGLKTPTKFIICVSAVVQPKILDFDYYKLKVMMFMTFLMYLLNNVSMQLMPSSSSLSLWTQ